MSSPQENQASPHKKTKRVTATECQIYEPNDEETDPVILKLSKIGCLEKHYKVQDCYFDTKDWRKCVQEVKEFQQCIKEAKKNE